MKDTVEQMRSIVFSTQKILDKGYDKSTAVSPAQYHPEKEATACTIDNLLGKRLVLVIGENQPDKVYFSVGEPKGNPDDDITNTFDRSEFTVHHLTQLCLDNLF